MVMTEIAEHDGLTQIRFESEHDAEELLLYAQEGRFAACREIAGRHGHLQEACMNAGRAADCWDLINLLDRAEEDLREVGNERGL